MKVLVHVSEIALKARKQEYFFKKLTENIRQSCNRHAAELTRIERQHKRIICHFRSEQHIITALQHVFGIHDFCSVKTIPKRMDAIEKQVRTMLKDRTGTVGFKTKRADKNFPVTSPDINKALGKIANDSGLKVQYKNPDYTIHTEITMKNVLIYDQKHTGPSGLPIGSSGKVLVLLSGGIDSPVAAWLMMRRGCHVDYLHVHPFAKNTQAEESKMKRITALLDDYQYSSTLHLVPYTNYEMETMGKIPQKYELVFFKHYLVKLAERYCDTYGYDAIVLGDSLGQVASQTIENIKATNHGVRTLVFRPLISYNKEEIIDLAKRIGTFELSIEEYKDCCSILTEHPETRTKLADFTRVLKNIDMNQLIESSLRCATKLQR